LSGPAQPQRRLAVASVVVLLLWLGVWFGVTESSGTLPPLLVVALLWLPLVPVVPMLWRGRRGALVWGSMIGVIYAGLALAELIANPEARIWAAGALGLSSVVTALLVRYARHWPADHGQQS
jgi:uncharacterized membrane protein